MKKTNNLIDHLKRGKKVTRIIAMHEFDVQNLTAMISKLRQRGMDIKRNERVDTRGTKYSEYFLA